MAGPSVAYLRGMRLPVPPPVDLAIAAAFLLFTVAEAVFRQDVSSPVAHVVVAGVAMVVLAWRRSFPIGVAAWVVATNVAINPEGEFSTLLSLVLVCYTIGAETEAPRSYAGLALVVVTFVGVSVREGLVPSDVAAAERTRIARELHDIVSHSISVVTIQTQAVRRRLGPEHQREADDLAAVEATAREALAEMRRLSEALGWGRPALRAWLTRCFKCAREEWLDAHRATSAIQGLKSMVERKHKKEA